MKNMTIDELKLLLADIEMEISGKVSKRQLDLYKLHVRYAEPNLAVLSALDWSVDGDWSVPTTMIPRIEQWAESQSREVYRYGGKRALEHAKSRELVSA